MKIKYTNTIDDLINFNLYHCKNSPTFRRKMLSAQFMPPALIAFIFLLRYMSNGNIPLLIFGILVSLIYIAISPALWRRSVKKSVRATCPEGENRGFVCEHEIEILDTGIVETTAIGRQESNWSAIQNVAETDDYIFIYIGSIMAHVIPKKRTSGDTAAFVTKLKSH